MRQWQQPDLAENFPGGVVRVAPSTNQRHPSSESHRRVRHPQQLALCFILTSFAVDRLRLVIGGVVLFVVRSFHPLLQVDPREFSEKTQTRTFAPNLKRTGRLSLVSLSSRLSAQLLFFEGGVANRFTSLTSVVLREGRSGYVGRHGGYRS